MTGTMGSMLAGIGLALIPAILGGAANGMPRQAVQHMLWSDVDFKISRLAGELGFRKLSPAVSAALTKVPREQFVPEAQRRFAYSNRPLSIGFNQTISQPLIVAIMTELLAVERGDKVYELGTGSGYQAAVLAELGVKVYSIEIIPELAERAHDTLKRLGYGDVEVRIGDGYLGWPDAAPFDAIIVTAAGDHIPPLLLQQLKPDGRLLIPIGGNGSTQKLVLVTFDEQGQTRSRDILPVAFVPITGRD